uniref:Myosin phosphatase Rho interacting protein n=1 Tax=Sparus aurata TaxID=8175 RepID=A0A671V4H1_SPAAU
MSTAKENPCRKFQANFFNKSKCQNCFKPRELHLLTDQDLTQAKPIYGGWLCLAPEGTDFDNPMQRSRKWQRRFFVLYEHGCLRFALDESVSNASIFGLVIVLPRLKLLCINFYQCFPPNSALLCLQRPPVPQPSRDPFPAPSTSARSTRPALLRVPTRLPALRRPRSVASPCTPPPTLTLSVNTDWIVICILKCVCVCVCVCVICSRSGVIEKLEALELENPEKMEVEESGRSGARQGRSEHRRFHREVTLQCACNPTPDLLNFKKGWMVKLDEQGQWKKYWFVLTDHSLRYYKDSIAEEASDLDGEIDLSTCCNVTEYQAQRNYGFQIHTQEGVHTLSAMTAGIRRNWIQAVMKNVRPSTAPDVASLTEDHGSFSPSEGLVRPDVTQDSPSSEASSVERESAGGVTKSRARERRREGRSKTFDWAEFRPIAQALAQQRAQEAERHHADLGELERSRRREERRKRYESVTSSSENTSTTEGGRTDCESGEGVRQIDSLSPKYLERQQRMEEVIEQHWHQVENTPIRDERRVPLPTAVQSRETAELEQLLENYKQGATCERGFAAMEESHQKVIDELQRKHQRELENLHEEKERLLAEETAATIAAIEAMKNAHRTELEKELDRARKTNSNTENADIEEIRRQHEEELCSFQREIEVLSEQYSQKCLENAHLAQALEAERQALRQCQRENQELNAHNQELNNRLAAEITKMRSMTSEDGVGDTNTMIQGKELYELEVMLRVKESEVQYLKQEINSLKDELQAAQRDKKYATDKYKDIYTELSIVKAKAERDLGRLRDQLQLAHEALGEPSLEEVERGGYGMNKNKHRGTYVRAILSSFVFSCIFILYS